jgi:Bacterial SH3 domain
VSAAASTSSAPSVSAVSPVSARSSAPLGVHAGAACDWKPSSPVYWPQQHFTANGVNIRTGPDTSCTSVGRGYSGQQITIYCYSGDWVYLYDDASRKSGWSEVQ